MTERDAHWHYGQMISAMNANAWPPSPEMFASWLHVRRSEAYRAALADVKAAVEEWFCDVDLDDLYAIKGWSAK